MRTILGIMYFFIAVLILGIIVGIGAAATKQDATVYFIAGALFTIGFVGTLVTFNYSIEPKN